MIGCLKMFEPMTEYSIKSRWFERMEAEVTVEHVVVITSLLPSICEMISHHPYTSNHLSHLSMQTSICCWLSSSLEGTMKNGCVKSMSGISTCVCVCVCACVFRCVCVSVSGTVYSHHLQILSGWVVFPLTRMCVTFWDVGAALGGKWWRGTIWIWMYRTVTVLQWTDTV